jgi:flavin-dependent dehydrogenase
VSSVGVVAAAEYFALQDSDPEIALRAMVDSDPRLKDYLQSAVFDTPVNAITGYASNVKRLWGDGFALLGNAGEFLDPVFSSGVTIAMKSASLAAAALDRQLNGHEVSWDAEFEKPLKFGVDVFRAFVESWYDGVLHGIIFSQLKDDRIKSMICSILAGYVWDERNPYVFRTRPRLVALAETLLVRDRLASTPEI